MNKQEMWKQYETQNPSFILTDITEEDVIKLKLRMVKKMADTSYDIGYRQGLENAQRIQPKQNNKTEMPDIFKDIFGKGF
jgi:hypothetical protein